MKPANGAAGGRCGPGHFAGGQEGAHGQQAVAQQTIKKRSIGPHSAQHLLPATTAGAIRSTRASAPMYANTWSVQDDSNFLLCLYNLAHLGCHALLPGWWPPVVVQKLQAHAPHGGAHSCTSVHKLQHLKVLTHATPLSWQQQWGASPPCQ